MELLAGLLLFTTAQPLLPADASTTFTVNSTGDPGDGVCAESECTLREALTAANSEPGLNVILFVIGSGLRTITPTSPLPTVTDPLIIDATSQPGFSGVPLVELSGSLAGTGANGLTITAGSSTVRGLIVNRFSNFGIDLHGNGGNTVAGNYLGTNASGTLSAANRAGVFIGGPNNIVGGTTASARNVISGNRGVEFLGVLISGSAATGNVVQGNYIGTTASGTLALGNGVGVGVRDAAGNTIGGTSPEARNIISGNSFEGVRLHGASFTVVQGNYIGLDAAGTVALRNRFDGVRVKASSNNTIGGTVPGAGNVISGNGTYGVRMNERGTGNTVQGNLIGTDATGSVDLGNGTDGVFVRASTSTTIGGTAPGAGNVISGNGSDGVEAAGSTTIQGNLIGTASDGSTPLGNSSNGVLISGNGNTIGGEEAGAGNVISSNGAAGVQVSAGSGNSVSANRIFSNAGLGIDLGPVGVTANDIGDGDAGANALQNFPALTSATVGGGSTTVSGVLASQAGQAYRLQLFSVGACDASGFGEGASFLGAVDVATDAGGTGTFTVQLPVDVELGSVITATGKDASGNTSEFSSCLEVVAAPTVAAGRAHA